MKYHNKKETSKLFLFIITLITSVIVLLSIWFTVKYETAEILPYLIPAVFAELGAATASYYIKAKNENKIKIILSAVSKIQKDSTSLTDEQVRVIEAMINNLNS